METQYLSIAIQYYVAGRSATLAGFMPVSGNLFHHAVEMLLKYFLIRASYSPEQLRDDFRHNLKKLWREFKKTANDPSLAQFDGLVSALNKVEELRYPRRGYAFSVNLRKGQRSHASGPAMKGFHHYQLNLEEIDEFVTTLLTGRVTPGWIKGLLLKEDARAQYEDENLHSFIG